LQAALVPISAVTTIIKSDGRILPFSNRPVAYVLVLITVAAMLWPLRCDSGGKFNPKGLSRFVQLGLVILTITTILSEMSHKLPHLNRRSIIKSTASALLKPRFNW